MTDTDTPTPMCSIVMPCFNVAETLDAQLDRLIPQLADADAELILVDNNSTDETLAHAEAAAAANDRVVVGTATDAQGVAYARNSGVDLARSDRLLFCDADDLVAPRWVAVMNRALDDHHIATGALDVDSLNCDSMAVSRGPSRRPTFYDLFAVAAGGNMAVRREAWDRVGRLDEDLPSLEDMDWSLRAALAGIDVAWVPEAVIEYRYRTNPSDLWRQGVAYGRSRPPIARRLHRATGRRPRVFQGIRSWAWLIVHLPHAARRDSRGRFAWVLGNRLGQLRGSIDARFLVL